MCAYLKWPRARDMTGITFETAGSGQDGRTIIAQLDGVLVET